MQLLKSYRYEQDFGLQYLYVECQDQVFGSPFLVCQNLIPYNCHLGCVMKTKFNLGMSFNVGDCLHYQSEQEVVSCPIVYTSISIVCTFVSWSYFFVFSLNDPNHIIHIRQYQFGVQQVLLRYLCIFININISLFMSVPTMHGQALYILLIRYVYYFHHQTTQRISPKEFVY